MHNTDSDESLNFLIIKTFSISFKSKRAFKYYKCVNAKSRWNKLLGGIYNQNKSMEFDIIASAFKKFGKANFFNLQQASNFFGPYNWFS